MTRFFCKLQNLVLVTPIIGALRLWHFVSEPLFGPRCRYYPSCSEYACGALRKHGFLHGLYLSVRRVSRCHPFQEGGVDLVP